MCVCVHVCLCAHMHLCAYKGRSDSLRLSLTDNPTPPPGLITLVLKGVTFLDFVLVLKSDL